MTGPLSPRGRHLCALVFAVVTAQLAALGHELAGGGQPDLALLLLGTAAAAVATAGPARKRQGFAVIFGSLAAGQLAFHLLFSIDPHDMTAPLLPAEPARMLAFHIAAAAVAALVMARGEAALFGLFAALRRVVTVMTPPAAVDLPPTWTVVVRDADAIRSDGDLLATSPRRGPPVR